MVASFANGAAPDRAVVCPAPLRVCPPDRAKEIIKLKFVKQMGGRRERAFGTHRTADHQVRQSQFCEGLTNQVTSGCDWAWRHAREYWMRKFVRLMNQPQPLRSSIRALVRNTGFGGPQFQFDIGAIERPPYAYLVYNAAKLAHRLGHQRVSILEFGVAGGEGLLSLERHADWVEKLFPVKIEVYGFDTGEGLPTPVDYRDLQYHWKAGHFRMDQEGLRSRLKRAKLVLGDVRTTAVSFLDAFQPAPIGGVSHDLDFYSSTMDALKLFDAPDDFILPRVFCYFDDVLGEKPSFTTITPESGPPSWILTRRTRTKSFHKLITSKLRRAFNAGIIKFGSFITLVIQITGNSLVRKTSNWNSLLGKGKSRQKLSRMHIPCGRCRDIARR